MSFPDVFQLVPSAHQQKRYLIGQICLGQNWWKFGWVTNILSKGFFWNVNTVKPLLSGHYWHSGVCYREVSAIKGCVHYKAYTILLHNVKSIWCLWFLKFEKLRIAAMPWARGGHLVCLAHSTFYSWTAASTGVNIFCAVRKLLSLEGRPRTSSVLNYVGGIWPKVGVFCPYFSVFWP